MQLKYHMITIEDLVPEDHFLRKLDAALDLSFVYKETYPLYNHRIGRPAIDPVMLIKYILIGYLYGIPSERQIEQRIQTDMAFRWYLGLDLFDRVPDHSTISQNRRRRPAFRKIFKQLFECVVNQCIEGGLVSGRLVATDSTHVKASASKESICLIEAPEEPGIYWERLDKYEEQALDELNAKTGQRRKHRTKQLNKFQRHPQKQVSKTDPDSGYLKRPGKPSGMYYLSHQTVDTDHGIILDVAVTAGNSSDAAPYLEQIERVQRKVHIRAATADSAYDFPLAHQMLQEQGISYYVSTDQHHVPACTSFLRDAFQYDPLQDIYCCPNQKSLRLNTVSRRPSGIHWVYAAAREDCQACSLRDKCLSTSVKNGNRKLFINYFDSVVQQNYAKQSTAEYRNALRLRQIWCEGTFATQKWCHNLTRVMRRGIEAAEDHCLLSATALNLKRMIKWIA